MIMKRLIFGIIFALVATSASALEGAWRGVLDLGRARLAIVLNFSQDAEGKCVCTFDSPDQGAYGIATRIDYLTADSVAVEVTMASIKMRGRIEGKRIEGTFEQGPARLPMLLEYQEPEAKTDLPYSVSEVAIPSGEALLAGTMCMPTDPKALVVMVTGSGPQNRDEELMGHKPFAVLADSLARRGIASIRYDDRGVAKSTGDFATATTDTLALDAARVVDYARTQFGGRVGIIGHSEGGYIAYQLGSEGVVDMSVAIAGPVVPCREIILDQNRHTLEQSGMGKEEITTALAIIDEAFDVIAAGGTLDFDAIAGERASQLPAMLMAQLRATSTASTTPWVRRFVGLDAAPYLRDMKCPLMAIFGTLDTQVRSSVNMARIRELCPGVNAKEYAGLNHLMQHAVTGEVAEYAEIEESMSPEVIADIIDFIHSTAAPKR